MELSEFIVLIGLKWSLEHVIAHIAAMFFRQKRERGKRKKGRRSARRNGNGKGRQEDERQEDGRLPTQLRCSGTEEPQSWQQTQWGGGSKIGGGGGGEQDRYFSAQGKPCSCRLQCYNMPALKEIKEIKRSVWVSRSCRADSYPA